MLLSTIAKSVELREMTQRAKKESLSENFGNLKFVRNDFRKVLLGDYKRFGRSVSLSTGIKLHPVAAKSADDTASANISSDDELEVDMFINVSTVLDKLSESACLGVVFSSIKVLRRVGQNNSEQNSQIAVVVKTHDKDRYLVKFSHEILKRNAKEEAKDFGYHQEYEVDEYGNPTFKIYTEASLRALLTRFKTVAKQEYPTLYSMFIYDHDLLNFNDEDQPSNPQNPKKPTTSPNYG